MEKNLIYVDEEKLKARELAAIQLYELEWLVGQLKKYYEGSEIVKMVEEMVSN